MENYFIPTNLKVMGLVVKNFPDGIGEAFHSLMNTIPGEFSRPYYGIAECIEGKMIYKAAALEKEEGEAEKLQLERYFIPKGVYLAEKVSDWRSKTECIKDVFGEMYKDERADHNQPSIEVYQNEKDMLCLVKVKEAITDYVLNEDTATLFEN